MPVEVQCAKLPLSDAEVDELWESVVHLRNFSDDVVVLQCVSEIESRRLNLQYRKKDQPTNVLTFSYKNEDGADTIWHHGDASDHDIALCLSVAEREAAQREISLRDYVALLVTHGFLHVTGMDHERSSEEATETQQLEAEVLEASGFHVTKL